MDYECITALNEHSLIPYVTRHSVSSPPKVLVCGIWEKHANSWEATVLTTVQPHHPRHVQSNLTPARTNAHTHTRKSVISTGSFLEDCCNFSSAVTTFRHKTKENTRFHALSCNLLENAITLNISAVGFQMHL